MARMKDRVALVTGAGRGIGRSIALAFAQEGARVVVTSRTNSELDEVVAAIQEEGSEALAIAADMSDRKVPCQVIEQVQKTYGPVEVLVINAGVGSSSDPKPVVDFDDAFWDLSLAVNLTAPYLLAKAVLPQMIDRQHGRIITVASINSKIGSFHGAAYAASKHGVVGLMRTLAMEVASMGITVNSICPGPVHTLMNDRRIEYDANRKNVDFDEQAASLTAIGRRLEPEEIAPLAVYLASDEAACMTGQAVNICGGTLMTG
ncbi:MAG: SDR family NAD(P)-dependent oxidoreductase [Planctomycetota bacterium]|jgi:NAD(P)-dependent dehydrogenase (short-subunit alcohol dehydrogenase family)|nr:SDR family NAD(P)-dependent oxidoreductase [Planctomycetota bacterium]